MSRGNEEKWTYHEGTHHPERHPPQMASLLSPVPRERGFFCLSEWFKGMRELKVFRLVYPNDPVLDLSVPFISYKTTNFSIETA